MSKFIQRMFLASPFRKELSGKHYSEVKQVEKGDFKNGGNEPQTSL